MKAEHVYWALCVAGAALPLSAFLPWFAEHGLDVPLFIAELTANPISMFFGWDVIVSALVLFAFIWMERGKGVRGVWLAPLATLTIGVSLGLPLYLALRERSLRAAG